MSEYIIMTDSTVDLPKEYLIEELQVPYIPLSYIMDGVTYEDMSGLSGKEFFDKIRAGSLPTTSQVNPEQAKKALEPYVKEEKDILFIGFSSALSGTFNSIRMAAEELMEEYPERKIITVDSLCACLGEGLLVYKAVQLKRAGKSLEEVAKWTEENKLHICHNVAIDDLNHLHRGGRVSKTAAIMGTMIQIKPIIHMNDNGELQVIGKQRGRKKALQHIVNMAVEQSKGWHICHNVAIDDLNHLHRGGRVSKTAAIMGTMIQIKPIIHMNDNGELQVIGKQRGRKKALQHIVNMAVEQSKGWENDIIMITHGDCEEDAQYVAKLVREKMGIENILINCIGSVIGSHTGPGVVAVFCMGEKR